VSLNTQTGPNGTTACIADRLRLQSALGTMSAGRRPEVVIGTAEKATGATGGGGTSLGSETAGTVIGGRETR
jgi:hypothetical protein